MSAKWDLGQPTALGRKGSWTVHLDPLHPEQPLRFCPDSEKLESWQAVAIRPLPHHSLQTEEVYVRENDLIVRFGQSEQDEYAFQLDWQMLGDFTSLVHGVELWVSIQTRLLDSSPELEISSEGEFAGWRVYQHEQLTAQAIRSGKSTTAAALVSSGTAGTTRLWLIEPSDQSQVRLLTAADESVQRVRLFGSFLEKGVIRRARMRFMIIEGELSTETLKSIYREFAASPLPLTA